MLIAETSPNDSLRISSLLNLASIQNSNISSPTGFTKLYFFNKVIQLSDNGNKLDFAAKLADSIGVEKRNSGKYNIALLFHEFALEISEGRGDKYQSSICCNNIGVVYRRIDEYDKAIEFHIKALKLAEEINERKSQAIAINSIGNIQMAMENYDEAMNYFQQSLVIERELKNNLGTAINLNNIGNVYFAEANYLKALDYYNLSLEINKQIRSKHGVAICYSDIGMVYQKLKDYQKALEYYQRALSVNINHDDKILLSDSYIHIGDILIEKGDYSSALKNINYGLQIAKQIGSKVNIMGANLALYKIEKHFGNFETSLQYYDTFHIYKDSIMSISLKKDIGRMRIRFESEAQENMISILEQQSKIDNLELKKQKIIFWLILIALIATIGAVTFLAYYLYQKNISNKILKRKNEEIDRANNNLEKLADDLLLAKQEAERSNNIKSEFLANISHEIRTPLNSVVGYSELLGQYDFDSVQKDYLNSIQLSAKSLMLILNDILDLSKIEAGKFIVEYKPVVIRSLFYELESVFKIGPEKNNVDIEFVVDENVLHAINFSDLRLRQIMLNLISNAIKFTDEGIISVRVKVEKSEIINRENLLIEVQDTGIGIPLEEQENIFEPFYQLDSNRINQGTGLGLSISKRLVEVLNGEILLFSKENQGSIFKIIFSDVEVLESDELISSQQPDNIFPKNYSTSHNMSLFKDFNLDDLVHDIRKISVDQPILFKKLVDLYLGEFKLARETALMANILKFNVLLEIYAEEVNNNNLKKYSASLAILINQFNIEGIEKYFSKFELAINKIIS